jgi:hypothetical protein
MFTTGFSQGEIEARRGYKREEGFSKELSRID